MTLLELLLGLTGFIVTALVVVAMILITPRGEVGLYDDPADPQSPDLARPHPREKVHT